MKNIFATIEYVAEKILEAITGHKNDEQAHPNLSEQINVLSKDRGYLNSFMSGADLNTFTQNGIYAYSQLSANKPSQSFGYLFVSDWGKGYCRQFVQDSENTCYTRLLDNNVWGDWRQLATTTKTDILFPYATGFTDKGEDEISKISKVNNLVTISLCVKKSDDGVIPQWGIIGFLPEGYRPNTAITSGGMANNNTVSCMYINKYGAVQIGSVATINNFMGSISFFVN